MKKILFIVGLCLTIFILLAVSLFYFLPIPKNLDKIVKSGAKIERCIYSGGIAYNAVSQLESVRGGIFSTIIYNGQGEKICSSGGYAGKQLEEQCKTKVCFPIYGK